MTTPDVNTNLSFLVEAPTDISLKTKTAQNKNLATDQNS